MHSYATRPDLTQPHCAHTAVAHWLAHWFRHDRVFTLGAQWGERRGGCAVAPTPIGGGTEEPRLALQPKLGRDDLIKVPGEEEVEEDIEEEVANRRGEWELALVVVGRRDALLRAFVLRGMSAGPK